MKHSIALAFVALAVATTAAQSQETRLSAADGNLMTGPWNQIVSRPGGVHFVRVEARNGQFVAALDGRESRAYDDIDRPTLSPDEQRFAFWARRGVKWSVVVDGQEGAAYDHKPEARAASMEDPAGRLVFSPDSKRLGYVAQNGNRYFVVVDGKAGPEYPTVSHPRFSPDSRRVAYVAAPGPRRWFGRDDGIPGRIVLDGQEGPLYDEISPAQFSADSEHTAYVVRKGERFLVVLNGKEGEPFDRIDYRTMRFSPAGRRLAYIAEEKGKAILIVDGVRTPARDAVSAPTFSPDGRRFAYVAKDGEKTFAVLEGQELARFDDVDSLGFSPNSERFAYWARTGNNWTAIIDGKAGPQYSGKMDPSAWTDVPVVFSPDSRRVAYAAWKGGSGPPTGFQLCGDSSEGAMFRGIAGAVAVAVVDGIEGPEFQHIFGPVFSQDSTRVGYIGFTSGEFGSIVIDGRAVASDRALPSGLRFSPNGKHVAYSAGPARNGNQSRACLRDTEISVFVDGAESSGYLSVWPAPLKDDALEFVAKKRDGFYRVRQPIAP